MDPKDQNISSNLTPSTAPEDPNASSPLKQIRTFQGDVAAALHNQNESLVSIQRAEVVRKAEKQRIFEAPVSVSKKEINTSEATEESVKKHILEQTRETLERQINQPKPVPLPEPVIINKPESVQRQIPVSKPEPIQYTQSENETLISPDEIEKNKNTKSGILLLVGIIFLLGIGGVGSFFAYKEYKAKTFVPVSAIVPNKFIATDNTETYNVLLLNKVSLIDLLDKEKSISDGPGFKQIQLLESPDTNDTLLESSKFFTLLESRAPSSLIRAFSPYFMLGTIGGNPKQTFILFKLESFENAFPGMLAWEKFMAEDILRLFQNEEVAKSISIDTKFKDVTIQNKDARTLKDTNGRTVLLYAFFDNSMLIITDSEETLRTIISRLNSEKLTR